MEEKQIGCRLLCSNKIRLIVLLLAVLHLLALMCYSIPKRFLRTDKHRDILAYYLVSERVQKNEPVYWPLPQKGSHEPSPHLYLYPPVFASLLGVFPSMSFVTFTQIWTILLYFAFWIYAACLTHLFIGRVSLKGILIAGLVLTLFPGTHIAISLGNIDPFLWALFGLALAVPTLRGSSLMAIALIKPWALWPLIWTLRERKRVWIGALFVAFGGAFLGLLVMGSAKFYTECLIWIREVLPSLGQGSWAIGSLGNWSISFAVLRVLKALNFFNLQSGVLPLWAKFWLILTGIIAPLLIGWFLRHKSKELQLSMIVCIAVLFSPICWTYSLPLLLPPVAIITGKMLCCSEKISNE